MTENKVKKKRGQFITIDFLFACLVSFLVRLGLQARSTATPLYIIALNYSKSAAGLASSAYTISALIFRPIVGMLIDKFGRKNMLIAGTAIIAVILVPLSFATDINLIYFFSVICGMGFSFMSTALSTIVTDLVPDESLAEGLGYFGLSSTLSQAIGPSMALWTIASFNYSGAFLTAAGLAVIALVCAFLIRYEKRRAEKAGIIINKENKEKEETAKKEKSVVKGPWWTKIIEPTAAKSGFMICFVTFASASIGTFLATYAKENAIEGIGMFFTIRAIGTAISRLFAGKVTKTIGNARTMKVSLLIMIIGYFGIAMSKSLLPLVIIGFVYAMGNGFFHITCNVAAVLETPRERRGAANATFYLLMDAGLGVGSAFWGVVADFTGTAGAFVGSGILTVCVFIFAVFYLRRVNLDKKAD